MLICMWMCVAPSSIVGQCCYNSSCVSNISYQNHFVSNILILAALHLSLLRKDLCHSLYNTTCLMIISVLLTPLPDLVIHPGWLLLRNFYFIDAPFVWNKLPYSSYSAFSILLYWSVTHCRYCHILTVLLLLLCMLCYYWIIKLCLKRVHMQARLSHAKFSLLSLKESGLGDYMHLV